MSRNVFENVIWSKSVAFESAIMYKRHFDCLCLQVVTELTEKRHGFSLTAKWRTWLNILPFFINKAGKYSSLNALVTKSVRDASSPGIRARWLFASYDTLASGVGLSRSRSLPASAGLIFIAWCLRWRIWKMSTESSIFAPTKHKFQFVRSVHHLISHLVPNLTRWDVG